MEMRVSDQPVPERIVFPPDEMPAAVVPDAPEPLATSLTPAERLRDMLDQGDVFDRLGPRRYKSGVFLGGVMVALLTQGVLDGDVNASVWAASFSGAVVLFGNSLRRHDRQVHVAHRMLQLEHDMAAPYDGEELEVYNHKKGNDRTLVWYGPQQDEPTTALIGRRLGRLAQDARTLGAEQLLIPKACAEQVGLADDEATASMTRHLRRMKGAKAAEVAKYSSDPPEMTQIHVDDIPPISPEQVVTTELGGIMALLEAKQPTHAAVRYFREHGADSLPAQRRLRTLLERAIISRIDGEPAPVVFEDQGDKIRVTLPSYASLTSAGMVMRTVPEPGNSRTLESTATALGASDAQVKLWLQHPELYPARTALACELTAWRRLRNLKTAPIVSDSSEQPEASAAKIGLHEYLHNYNYHGKYKDPKDKTGRRSTHGTYTGARLIFGASLGILSALGVGILGHQAGIKERALPIEQQADDPLILANKILKQPLQQIHDTANDLSLPFRIEAPPKPQPKTDQIGNRPVWYVDTANGFSAVGMWQQSTLNVVGLENGKLNFDNGTYKKEREALQDAEYLNQHTQPMPGPEALKPDQPYAHLQNTITLGNYQVESDMDEVADGYRLIPVPVLMDAQIVAVRIDGQANARLFQRADGSYGILARQLDDQAYPKLEYWVAYPDIIDIAPRPTRGAMHFEDGMGDNLHTNQLWQEAMAKKGQQDFRQSGALGVQTSAVASWRYDLNPPISLEAESSVNAYLQDALADEIADCKRAARVLAFSNPTTLSLAGGYRNKSQAPDGRSVLAVREAHEVALLADGTFIDASPPDTEGQFEQYFAENFTQTEPTEIPRSKDWRWVGYVTLAVAGAGTGVGLYGQRKQLRQSVRAMRGKRAADQVVAYGDDAIKRTAAALNQAAFGQDGSVPRGVQVPSREQALDVIGDYAAGNSRKELARLLGKLSASSRGELRVLHQSLRVARAVRRARQAPKVPLTAQPRAKTHKTKNQTVATTTKSSDEAYAPPMVRFMPIYR
jgi:hypothetical protein